MLRITLVLIIVGESLGQVTFSGSCPNLNTIKNFEVQKYMGKWYEFAKYTIQAGTWTQCLTAIYTLDKNGSFKITTTVIPMGKGPTQSDEYIVVPISNSRDGKFTITPKGELYWVLDTDYKSWVILWSCRNSEDKSVHTVWIYTRVQNPSNQVIKAAYAAAAAYNFDKQYLTPTNKKGCPVSY